MFRRKNLDEMEQDIQNKSVIVSQRFTEILLAVWVLLCLFTNRSFALPAYVLLSQCLVRLISAMIYKRQVGDERWKRGLVILASVICGAIFLVLLISLLLVGKAEGQQ